MVFTLSNLVSRKLLGFAIGLSCELVQKLAPWLIDLVVLLVLVRLLRR